MRVLFWQELFWPNVGGVEVMASNLIPALRERGHEIIVATRRDDPDLPAVEHYRGIEIRRFPFWAALKGRSMDRVLELRRQVIDLNNTFKPDLVHLNCFGPSWLFQQDIAARHAAPLLVTLHATPQELLTMRALGADGLLRRVLLSASWVACVSENVLKHIRQLVPEITSYSSVLYNGLQEPSVAPAPLPLHPPRLLCIGRLVPEKGFDLALRAFALLTAEFPGARLIIAGDGLCRADLQSQAAELGLAGVVDFIGWVAPDRIAGLLNSATVLILPSHFEALPSVALEAGIMGRPLVASRVGGVPEVVVDRETGLLVEPGDVAALADRIGFLLRRPAEASSLGDAARRRILNVFGFDRYVEGYDGLYRSLGRRAA